MELFGYLFIGMVIGTLSGFFGVGGGFLLTPLLLLLGYAPVTAIAMSLLYTIGTSVAGIFAHFRLKNIEWKIALPIGLSGIVATQFAHPFVLYLEEHHYDKTVIPLIYLLLLSYFAFSMLKKRSTGGETIQTKRTASLLTIIAIGFFSGFMSTSLGVGGGFILVPLLISVIGLPPKKAVGTSLFGVLFMVVAGFATYAFATPINYTYGLSLIAGAFITSQLGASLTTYYHETDIRRLLGFLYVATAASVLLKLAHHNTSGFILLTIFVTYLISLFTIKFTEHRKSEKAVINEKS